MPTLQGATPASPASQRRYGTDLHNAVPTHLAPSVGYAFRVAEMRQVPAIPDSGRFEQRNAVEGDVAEVQRVLDAIALERSGHATARAKD
jgi:hypothetical protein